MIKELKRGTGRKMIRSGSPKVLLDDCFELEAEIRSSTASNIFELEGEVLKTVMNGETTNITQLCEFLGGMIGSTSATMQSHTLMTSGYLFDDWDQVLGLVLRSVRRC